MRGLVVALCLVAPLAFGQWKPPASTTSTGTSAAATNNGTQTFPDGTVNSIRDGGLVIQSTGNASFTGSNNTTNALTVVGTQTTTGNILAQTTDGGAAFRTTSSGNQHWAFQMERNQGFQLDGLYVGQCGTATGGSCITSSSNSLEWYSNATRYLLATSASFNITNTGLVVTSTKNKACVALTSGTATATVTSGTQCVCSISIGALVTPPGCAVSGTTLTITGVGTDTICYHCF